MYSRCPHCMQQQALSVEQLRQGGGLLVCPGCGEQFDGLRFLSEQAEEDTADAATVWQFDQSSAQTPAPAVWRAGTVIMSLVLVAQIIFFEGENLSRSPMLSRGLESVCAFVHCRLPIYRNLDELAVSNASLQAGAGRSYQFVAAISNQGSFTQRAPNLKLTLWGFNAQPLAERVFTADEYLASFSTLATEQTLEIRLQLAAPSAKVGGFTFTLI